MPVGTGIGAATVTETLFAAEVPPAPVAVAENVVETVTGTIIDPEAACVPLTPEIVTLVASVVAQARVTFPPPAGRVAVEIVNDVMTGGLTGGVTVPFEATAQTA